MRGSWPASCCCTLAKAAQSAKAISDIIDYAKNPEKTDHGRLITSYQCDSRLADAKFLLDRQTYAARTGRVRGKERRLNVVEILEEVVSGESLSARPKMLRLLELVNTGMYEGLHDPIVTQEQWDAVRAKQRERGHVSVNTNRKLANPFASILYCEKCGALMKRNVPSKKQSTLPWYRCPTRGCGCRAIKCDFAEDAILDAMRSWLAEYTIKVKSDDLPQTYPIDTALSVVQSQLAQLRTQQDNICEYLEKGVYTIEMFTKRNDILIYPKLPMGNTL